MAGAPGCPRQERPWRPEVVGGLRGVRSAGFDPAANDFFLILGERRNVGVFARHLVIQDQLIDFGLVRLSTLHVVRIVGNPLQVEDVAKFALGPWQLRPVAIQALGFEDIAHPGRILDSVGIAFRSSAACEDGAKEEGAGEEMLQWGFAVEKEGGAAFLSVDSTAPQRSGRAFTQSRNRESGSRFILKFVNSGRCGQQFAL